MNKDALWEVADIIRVKYKLLSFRELTEDELVDTYEFKHFAKQYPNLVGLVLK